VRTDDGDFGRNIELHGNLDAGSADGRIDGCALFEQRGADSAGLGDGRRGSNDGELYCYGGYRDCESNRYGDGDAERRFENGNGDRFAADHGDQPAMHADDGQLWRHLQLHGNIDAGRADGRIFGCAFFEQHGANGAGVGSGGCGGNDGELYGHGSNRNGESDRDGDGDAKWRLENGNGDRVAADHGDQPAVHTDDGELWRHLELHGYADAGGADGRIFGCAFFEQYGIDGAGVDSGGCGGNDGDLYGHGGYRNGESDRYGDGDAERRFENGNRDRVAADHGNESAVHTHDGELWRHLELHGNIDAGGADGRIFGCAFFEQYGANGAGLGDGRRGSDDGELYGHGRNRDYESDRDGDGDGEWRLENGNGDSVAADHGDESAVHADDGEFRRYLELHGYADAGGADGRIFGCAFFEQYGADSAGLGGSGCGSDHRECYCYGRNRDCESDRDGDGDAEREFQDGIGDRVANDNDNGERVAVHTHDAQPRRQFHVHGKLEPGGDFGWRDGGAFGEQYSPHGAGICDGSSRKYIG